MHHTSFLMASCLAGAISALGCASSGTASTTTTAAEVASRPESGAEKPAVETSHAHASRTTADDAKGELVCRTKSRDVGTIELFVDWKGIDANGILRQTAPSGYVTTQKVHAERHKGMVVADDINATDLAVHAATIREQSGREFIRLGDWRQPWAPCE